MLMHLLRRCRSTAAVCAAALLAACTAPSPAPRVETKPKEPPACVPAAANEKVAGNWLSVRTQKGVTGELRTLITLNPDGTMAYTELLKRGKHPSQGLYEAGCWKREQQTLTLQTLTSNGSPVEFDDPIYTNRYTIVSSTDKTLDLRSSEGVLLKGRRMSPGYRLPF
ncbi:hypothetical protein [Parapusillimonas granuli]|uniref:Lipoprotein n=1 Tax=Parapusillimonas granuli TaxID=380911 RepID=A0A853G857_9BURK|nr:hypothetical protein [Parapusillimonas granuli]MBB5215845.1 hypothetical protein [Parapusillimonas granuli]NYT50856.1 hypothetical protein [Parapusillimonas granuli]